ncbi:folate family ECF transporter S component [Liquorilactobacillus mali]|uniref:folate family ECF transporter S component n=1 Tax=Liquorilactobacillus mali TaxID=1618 RepID=UPI002350B12C|nr:folate family ECF transporter S component [Liquorilactobacillus mali]MDC7953271.1 folate family ECF transporter S component [Liquorilactobacillus mali]
MNSSFVSRLSVRNIVLMGLLIALNIVVAKFLSFGIWSVRISFTFVVVFFMAYWFGPLLGAIGAACADVVGTLIFGGLGGYFAGFTLSAFLGAFVYGILFYKKDVTLVRVIIAVLINIFLVDALMNTYWITLLYHTDFEAIFPARFIKELLMVPVQIILLYALGKNKALAGLVKRID